MKLKPNTKLMIYIDNFCMYTTVKQVQDQKLLKLLKEIETAPEFTGIGTNIETSDHTGTTRNYSVQITVLT